MEVIQEELSYFAMIVQLMQSSINRNLIIISLQKDIKIRITFLSSFCALNDNDIASALLDTSSDLICKIKGDNFVQKGLLDIRQKGSYINFPHHICRQNTYKILDTKSNTHKLPTQSGVFL